MYVPREAARIESRISVRKQTKMSEVKKIASM